MTSKTIHVSGKRKRAIAKATLRPGTGKIRVNKTLLENFSPLICRQKLVEALTIAGPVAKKVNIDVSIVGGGIVSQVDAAKIAIARALLIHTKDKKLEKAFLSYDRQFLVADVRRKEPAKPNRHGQARAKRQKSYR